MFRGWFPVAHSLIRTYALSFPATPQCTGIIWRQTEIVSEYDQEILNHKLQTNPRHCGKEPHNNHKTPERQTKQSNQLSPFPIKMIAKLEWTKSNTQQNIEQLQNPTMGVTINNESTTTELPP